MSLGVKTEFFFKTLKAELNSVTPVSIDAMPILQLRKDNENAFMKYSGPLPAEISSNDFVRSDLKLSSSIVVPLVTYTPAEYSSSVDPTVMFFYGSGFVINLLSAHFPGIATFAHKAKCKVIAIDYPLAPELNCVEILNIVYDTFYYIITHAEEFDINSDNLSLVGYSSGGNLATGIIYRGIIENENFPIRRLVLLNPWLDLSFEIHNHNPFVDAQNLDEMLSTEALIYLASLYMGSHDPKFPLVSPIFMDSESLSKFPSTFILSAQYDRLRGTVHTFSEKLSKAGAKVTEKIFSGQTHNFFIARAVMCDGEDPSEYIGEIL